MKDEEPMEKLIIAETDPSITQHVIAEGTPEFTSDPSNFMGMFGDATSRAESFMDKINEQAGFPNNERPIVDAVAMPDHIGNPDAMGDLLRRMNGRAEHAIDTVIRDTTMGTGLQRALITESTKDDTWKIQMNENVSSGKYRIINGISKKSFFTDISLLEAAKKICDCLENEHAVNSKKIQKVLYYDQVYSNQYNECQNFKRLHKRYKSTGDNHKMNLMADKYDYAKEKALAAKQSIKTL